MSTDNNIKIYIRGKKRIDMMKKVYNNMKWNKRKKMNEANKNSI